MVKDFVVAIELGSSKITGIAGRKNADGSITILAVVKEDSRQCIRKGVIYNIDKTCACLSNIIERLRQQLRTEIAQVYIGVGGQSIRSIKNVIVRSFDKEEIVTQQIVDELMDTNRAMSYPDQEILYAEAQEYRVGTQHQLDPVGIPCTHLEGNILNILWRKSFYKNLNLCFETAGIPIADMLLAPLMLADSVLTESEKRIGCMLVDLGADTTTVSVYYKNILRHLAVIPLGGNNITKDISSLQLEESDAERLKLQYGSAWTDEAELDTAEMIPIDTDRSVEKRKFLEIIEGRVQEIIENVKSQVPGEYADRLLGGIIITGGGANLRNIDRAFRIYTKMEKVRIARNVTCTINTSDADIKSENCMMNTILGLLARGNMNCAGKDLTEATKNIFEDDAITEGEHQEQRPPRKPGETERGVIPTGKEMEQAEAERISKERANGSNTGDDNDVDSEDGDKGDSRPSNNIFSKIVGGFKKFVIQIVNDKTD